VVKHSKLHAQNSHSAGNGDDFLLPRLKNSPKKHRRAIHALHTTQPVSLPEAQQIPVFLLSERNEV